VGSNGQGARAPLEFFSFLDNLGSLLALKSNNKYSNKLIVKMLRYQQQIRPGR